MTSPTEPRPTELEIKFHLPEGAEAALGAHPALKPGRGKAPPPREEVTTYFDTPDHALARAGASLRVRRSGGRHVQTLKLRGGDTPFGRGEWEWPVPDSRPDLSRLAETPFAKLAEEQEALAPLFTAEVTRAVRLLRRGDSLIEMTIDRGRLRAGEAQEPIGEMELELKEGRPASLYRLAESLLTDLPLRLGTEAKSDRGWWLLTGQPRKAPKLAAPDFPPDVSAAEAFRRMAGATLATLLANQPAAASGAMEGVHQMRVSIRRLRAGLSLFRPCLLEEKEALFTESLRGLGRMLGEARDWDVFCEETLPRLAGDGVPAPLLDALRGPAGAERRAAHERLAAEFDGTGLTRLVLGLAAWVEDPAALSGREDGGAMAEPLADLAPELEERLDRRVRRRGRRIRHRSDEELHDLRKALKKLRYAVEFLAPLHRKKRVEAYLDRCKDLQEQLGALNDAAMAVRLTEHLAGSGADLDPSLEAVKAWAGERRGAALEKLPKAWRRFKDGSLPRLKAD
ncbi:Inorganic triphosphatase YgiF, contains CYTH and CHAD domains [Roseomonas rosea]|uniref:Inorganic triphosphatase YgiF, contains CYTH and CHAD domains n=1 Tax=Muricoccus roseus TaxID=198092 RepID=A0A1M6PE47_9PROT|nr:CYTH and CHAD domain-containing protein [Roseomonas rosea]SHK06191.1 Inorganic triphosphatase YgiF, contains CYTH and CHAD domains [Roseomonas rosea]